MVEGWLDSNLSSQPSLLPLSFKAPPRLHDDYEDEGMTVEEEEVDGMAEEEEEKQQLACCLMQFEAMYLKALNAFERL